MSAGHITVTVDATVAAKIIEQYAEEVNEIAAQRDELLSLTKYILDNGTCFITAVEGEPGANFEEWEARAEAAIARVNRSAA